MKAAAATSRARREVAQDLRALQQESEHDETKVGALKKSSEAGREKVHELECRLVKLRAEKDATLTKLVPTAATTAVTSCAPVDEALAAAVLVEPQKQTLPIADPAQITPNHPTCRNRLRLANTVSRRAN
ncbi:MAG: hypothetical protein M1826_003462 [Phylliscum demangeonii]|nr:MAG: hypothetical protein M1826_003462 [Phylliscum demangeonii]